MKLLFDENLSPRLVTLLFQEFPDFVHVSALGLKSAPDQEIWNYAARNGFTVVTKDADFRQRSFLFGYPPKVIGIRMGNCSTDQIAILLRKWRVEIEAFARSKEQAFLSLE